MTRYALRAEALIDIFTALEALPYAHCELTPCDEATTETVMYFYSPLSLDGVLAVLRQVEDGHIMVRTVAAFADYTGEELREG